MSAEECTYTYGHVRTNEEKGRKRLQLAKKAQINRKRKRLYITISEENYIWAKENLQNVSDTIDKYLTGLRTGNPFAVYLFEEIEAPTGWARGSAWLERAPDKRKVRGSNPRGPIFLKFN